MTRYHSPLNHQPTHSPSHSRTHPACRQINTGNTGANDQSLLPPLTPPTYSHSTNNSLTHLPTHPSLRRQIIIDNTDTDTYNAGTDTENTGYHSLTPSSSVRSTPTATRAPTSTTPTDPTINDGTNKRGRAPRSKNVRVYFCYKQKIY